MHFNMISQNYTASSFETHQCTRCSDGRGVPSVPGGTEYSDGTPHCHWYRNRFLNRLIKLAWEPVRTANKKGSAGLEKNTYGSQLQRQGSQLSTLFLMMEPHF